MEALGVESRPACPIAVRGWCLEEKEVGMVLWTEMLVMLRGPTVATRLAEVALCHSTIFLPNVKWQLNEHKQKHDCVSPCL